jgi:hypothetical protein
LKEATTSSCQILPKTKSMFPSHSSVVIYNIFKQITK